MKQIIKNLGKRLVLLMAFLPLLITPFRGWAQSTEIQQLILNAEKLSQFKNILNQMKAGYDIISYGYNAIKDVAEGNFSLHSVFIDGLMIVSPEVRKYGRIADIVSMQGKINAEYRSALSRFKASGLFNTGELGYMGSVYGKLFNQAKDDIDDLLMVITDGQLRMNDEERLAQIDRIYMDLQDKLVFLRKFNESGDVLAAQRSRELKDIIGVGQFFKKGWNCNLK